MNTTSAPDLSGRTGEVPALKTGRALDRLTVPGPLALLMAILFLRLLLIGLVVGIATEGPAIPSWILLMAATLSLGASASLAWRLRRQVRDQPPGSGALFLQALVDVVLVTSLVAAVRSESTPIAAFYLAILTAYAFLLPVGRSLVIVAFAIALCYVALMLYPSGLALGPEVWSQLGVIAFVGGLISVLGHRLAAGATEQRALEEALAQARLEADEILGSIQSGVMTVDADGILRYLNPRARKILGGRSDSFTIGSPVLEALRAKSRELHDAILQGISEGTRVGRGEASVRREDGSLFPVGLSTTTFHRPGSDRFLVTGIFTDISELKRLQEFRLRAERLEAIAALSASLAHEIRNPLAAIRSAVEQLARAAGADEDERTLADLVMRESERLNRLLSEFLDFSRVRATRFERLDLCALVRTVARTVAEHPAARNVAIEVQGDSLLLDADADLLHRIISNLMLNAVQAVDGQGSVVVCVGLAEPGEAPRGPVDRPVKLTVNDNGPGIPISVQERLFEPFATGRPGGTGLGLPIVQRAVAAHRGVILVDTAPTLGTTFSIFLPATWNGEETA